MMTVSLVHYLILAAILFSIGVMGIFINRRNLIMLLMSIELMLLAVNLNFIAVSHYLGISPIRFSCFSTDGAASKRRSDWEYWWFSSDGSVRSRPTIWIA